MQKLRNLFPEAESMGIDYYGDGDDFGEFSDLTVWGKEEVIVPAALLNTKWSDRSKRKSTKYLARIAKNQTVMVVCNP
ncbi:MAG: hypothetical protein HOH59_10615 [Rhodospirillaceae bacterium]|nr:hypothetical protein [Rhodospirillaceae bacterium]